VPSLAPVRAPVKAPPLVYVPTPEDWADYGEYRSRLDEALDDCPYCGEVVAVGHASELLGGRYLHRACANVVMTCGQEEGN
jgi:hypothetical protein